MSIFSKVGKAITTGLKIPFSIATGNFKSLGNLMNDFTGVTGSSEQAFEQSKELEKLNFENQKTFAQNAHQWEMADLKAAGLNPALTTGAASAGAIAGSGTTSNTGTTGHSAFSFSPLDIVSSLNQTSATKHQNQLQKEQAGLTRAQAIATIEMLPLNKKEKEKYIKLIEAQTNTQKETARDIRNKHPILNRLTKGEDEPYKEPTREQRKKGHLY